jgi:hypothetical protein
MKGNASLSVNGAPAVATPDPKLVALTGRLPGGPRPRAKALRCSLKPFHG